MSENTKHEPLVEDPKWRQVNSPSWQSQSVMEMVLHPPAAYALGFENGAYALAEKLIRLFEEQKSEEAIRLLMDYHHKLAHPVRGWEHEPTR